MTSEEIAGLFKVQTFDQVSASPVDPLAMATMLELVEAGYAEVQSYYWDDKAIALVDRDGKIAAFIIYRFLVHTREVFVTLGGTAAYARRGGLYGFLWRQFVDHVREAFPAARAIASGYSIKNTASAAMHAALGREVTGVSTRFPLKD